MSIKKLPAIIRILLTLIPHVALAQAGSENPGQRGLREAADPADVMTVSFTVPPDEIQNHDYHIVTFTDNRKDGIVTGGGNPDESGVIQTTVYPAVLTRRANSSSDDFHSFLAAFNEETREWSYQMNLSEVQLKGFIISLAISRRQPTETRGISRRQAVTSRSPLYEFEHELPEDVMISLYGERLFFAEIAGLINRATGCVIFEESGTLKITRCY